MHWMNNFLRRSGSPAASYKGGVVGSIPTCRTIFLWLLLITPLYGSVGVHEGELYQRGYCIRITHWGVTVFGDKEILKDMIDIYYNKAFPHFRGNEYVLSGYQALLRSVDETGCIVFSKYGDQDAAFAALEYASIYEKVLTTRSVRARMRE